MPSAKSHRSQVNKAVANRTVRSFARSRVTKARDTVSSAGSEDATSEDATQAVKDAISALDRAARKGVIHPNQAARKKSRLQRSLNNVSSS